MAVRLDRWMVKWMLASLNEDPDRCIVLGAAHWPQRGQPRVRDGAGRRIHLVRYLYERYTGEDLPIEIALLPGGCRTPGCQNPMHRIKSRRRTPPKRKAPE